MVQLDGAPNTPSEYLPTPARLQQGNTKPVPFPSDRLRSRDGDLLAVCSCFPEHVRHKPGPCGALLPSGDVWAGDIVFG